MDQFQSHFLVVLVDMQLKGLLLGFDPSYGWRHFMHFGSFEWITHLWVRRKIQILLSWFWTDFGIDSSLLNKILIGQHSNKFSNYTNQYDVTMMTSWWFHTDDVIMTSLMNHQPRGYFFKKGFQNACFILVMIFQFLVSLIRHQCSTR